MKTGGTYTLKPGTTVVITEDGERYRHTVEVFEDIEMTIDRIGGAHATMNGGGRDYFGHCPHTGYEMLVRTTFARPESETFYAGSGTFNSY